MCGIAGWFSSQIIPSSEIETLERMTRCIKHRGPDGEGNVLLPYAGLGHVRLSIIDLNSGQQPMKSHDQRFTITYNGEIYNYKELRKELIDSGHHFFTHSDTEVIMEMYRKYGHQGFSRLRGMYAFALWDKAENLGLLARDPMGIKPLFVQHTTDSSLAFASEAKAIFEKSLCKPQLDAGQLHLLMNFRYLPGNTSLFQGIKQLPPGKILQWQPDVAVQYFNIDIPTAYQGSTLEKLRSSVYSHMTSDVEVGCYLSGGIDSSTVAALCKEKAGENLRTFTIDVGDDPKEALYAAETAKYFGIQNIQYKIEDDITLDFNKLLWHLEVPKINAIQNWQLAKFTSQHVKVALSGLGGDELFLGYNLHKLISQAHTVSKIVPTSMRSTLGSALKNIYQSFNKLQWSEPERSLLIFENLGNWPLVYGLIRNVWDSPAMRTMIYGERMLSSQLPNAFEYLQQQWPENSDPVIAAAEFEWSNKLVNDLLWQEDRVSMAHGLEVRTPLVDRIVYSHVKRYPRDALMERGNPKAYMKKTVSTILPQQILDRPKSGFQVASFEFFHQHLTKLAHEILNEKTVREIGIFNYAFIKHVLKFTPTKRLRWHYFILYFMILTHLWVQLFESQNWSEKP